MKKLVILLTLIFVANGNASSFMENNELKLVDDKKYIIRCIEGTKWIQFLERGSGKGGTYYVPSGNPQQMFERERNNYGGISVPVVCNDK